MMFGFSRLDRGSVVGASSLRKAVGLVFVFLNGFFEERNIVIKMVSLEILKGALVLVNGPDSFECEFVVIDGGFGSNHKAFGE
jgi:hypothetical protein